MERSTSLDPHPSLESGRSTVRDLRRRNRSTLLTRLFFDGPLSRQELSQLTGLSVGTVSNVTADLVEERLIVEAGLVDSDGGRPRVLLRVDPRYGSVVGIDVGETGVKVELFDLGMARIATVEHPLHAPRPEPARSSPRGFVPRPVVEPEESAQSSTRGFVPRPVVQPEESAQSSTRSLVPRPVVQPEVAEPEARGFVHRPVVEPEVSAQSSTRSLVPRPVVEPDEVVALVAAGLREVITRAGVDESGIIGVGIGLPGTVEQAPRVLVHAQVIGWDAVPFGELLRAAGVTLPLYFDNGAKTQGQAEMWSGAGRGARHAVIALVGSGVGAAVITNGSTYQGATSSAGEWGHTTIVYGGRECRCGASGCLEAYVGAESILDRYRQARGGRAPADPDEQAGLAALIAAAGRSRTAARVLEETSGYLGAGIANLINLFNPERIVLGGWAGIALGQAMLPQIRAAAEAYALHRPYQQATIELCQLGPDAVAFGAATLPVARLLALGGDPREVRRPRARGAVTAA